MPIRRGLVSWITLGALAAPGHASPLGDPAVQRAVFAGSTAAHPTSLTLNPAALALGVEGFYLHVSGSSTFDRVHVRRRVVDPDTGDLSDGAARSAMLWSPGGSFGFYKVGGRLSVGLQVALPSGESFLEGGDDLGYHSRGGGHREYSLFVIGGAYRWRGLAFGATLRVVETRLRLRFDRDTALERGDVDGTQCGGGPCGFENPAARERYDVDVTTGWLPSSSNTVAVTFGGVAEVAADWWVGLAYHVPQGLFSGITATGTVDVERAPADLAAEPELRGEASVGFRMPWRLQLGTRGRILEGLDAVGEARWDRTSDLDAYDVRLYGLELEDAGVPEIYPRPRGLRDHLAIQAGVEQVDTGGRWRFGARLGLERGATKPSRLSPLQVYPTALDVDLGAQLRLDAAWTVQLGAGLAWSPTRDSGRGAYDPLDRLDCIDAGFDIDDPACAATRAGYALPTASGTYGRVGSVAWLSLKWQKP